MKGLTKIEIEEICKEIELQWDYLLMARAIFYSKFPHQDDFYSPSFYSARGISFHVTLPEVKSERFSRAAKGIAVWLNQNYVLRLYGILDSKELIKLGKATDSKIIQLVTILRMNVGSHSTGRHVSKRSELRKATKLTNSLFGREIDLDKVNVFTLSIDSVLLPLKNQVLNFVRSLEL
jgi:hypothetical protein